MTTQDGNLTAPRRLCRVRAAHVWSGGRFSVSFRALAALANVPGCTESFHLARKTSRRRIAPWPAFVLALLTAGCSLDDYVRQDGFWLVWLSSPLFVTLIVGAASVYIVHGARLKKWDLRDSVSDPGTGTGLLVWYVVVALFVGVSFTIYSFTVEAVDPAHRLGNIMWWWLGGAVGSIAGWFLGRRFAVNLFERA